MHTNDTLSSDYKAGYTVWNTSAGCKKCDAHYNIRYSQCVSDNRHLHTVISKHYKLNIWYDHILNITSVKTTCAVLNRQVMPKLKHAYHPHHEVWEDSDPQSGEKKGEHKEILPAWLRTVWHGEVQQHQDWPWDDELHSVHSALCRKKETAQLIHCAIKGIWLARNTVYHEAVHMPGGPCNSLNECLA